MSILKTKKFRIEAAILTAVGLALSIVIGIRRQSDLAVWFADMFFAEASVFLCWGIIRSLGNMHAFTSAAWGFRQFHRIFRKETLRAEKEKNDYLAYRESRPHHNDAKALLVISAVLIALSLLVSLTLCR